MLGKNRIRRIEGLQRCCRLSVLDLHGNRITQISGLDNLAELKVLNLAGNQIRKICYMQGLISLEELVSTRVIYDRVWNRKIYFEIAAFLNFEQGGTSRAGNSNENTNINISV